MLFIVPSLSTSGWKAVSMVMLRLNEFGAAGRDCLWLGPSETVRRPGGSGLDGAPRRVWAWRCGGMSVYYCRTRAYEKAVSGGEERKKGGHVLKDTTSCGLCGGSGLKLPVSRRH